MIKTTVIVTNYNYAYYLSRCIRSLINQTDQDYHVVIVDDSSDDYSHQILELWEGHPKLEIKYNKKNIGLGPSCNTAIRSVTSRYVVRVDADDFVCNEYVYMLSRFLDHNPTVDAVCCDYYETDGDFKMELTDAREKPIACGIMFRTEVLWDIGMYPDDRSIREDIDTRKRFEQGGYRMGHLQVPLYRYHKRPGTMSDAQGSAEPVE